MAAAQQVYNTFELLEMILGYLPARDVLRCEAVCRQMQFVAKTSLPLRQKLHLEANPTSSLLTANVEPRFFHTYHAIGIGQHFACGEIELWRLPRRDESHGSWRRMFPCQPAPAAILLGVPRRYSKRPLLTAGEGQQGVTFGMIMDTLFKYSDETAWEQGMRAKFYALSEAEIPFFMARYDCEQVSMGTRGTT
ncbi:uncharacterized protein MYCFIDRAFT_213900 [Pseudocercospora fijiensis CIRAD86]|uniref:F-box domain-containing protein n=1 Tax=Pseudocercospora fijiensis (strain CIRAD86) TaxID=383855 RepID=M3B886_PSEFD|nr:uncharacterized protein MYCFIDRAFT_213900 [Pseudocercospora fijiensis CIRAD86]EME85537.1 hypothetical protein MYCFIDRAFT_213900 [Pseudocercospora fijiensis CIRAD86]